MPLDVIRFTDTIRTHSVQLARSADGLLERAIAHCPGWTITDLLEHLIKVHWFWATIVAEGRSEPPAHLEAPPIPGPELVGQFLIGAEHLVEVLAGADQRAPVWTWTPLQRNVAFVTRHQVQEILVHHFDVANALGETIDIDPEVAADSIGEFLTFSISTPADPADPARSPLEGALALECRDVERAWTIRDVVPTGTLEVFDGRVPGVPALVATSAELLLWLYSRVELDADAPTRALGARLRALSFTD